MLLLLAQSRYQPGIREPGQGPDIVGIPLDVHPALASIFQMKDRLPSPVLLPMRGFAFSVKVPDGSRQQLGNVGMFTSQRVPDMVYADNVALAPFQSTVDTEEADDIAVIRVEELACCGSVDADFVDLAGVVPDIFDVAQYVATTVLRDEVAKVCPQTHVGGGCLLRVPFAGWKALEEDEALAVKHVRSQSLEDLA